MLVCRTVEQLCMQPRDYHSGSIMTNDFALPRSLSAAQCESRIHTGKPALCTCNTLRMHSKQNVFFPSLTVQVLCSLSFLSRKFNWNPTLLLQPIWFAFLLSTTVQSGYLSHCSPSVDSDQSVSQLYFVSAELQLTGLLCVKFPGDQPNTQAHLAPTTTPQSKITGILILIDDVKLHDFIYCTVAT